MLFRPIVLLIPLAVSLLGAVGWMFLHKNRTVQRFRLLPLPKCKDAAYGIALCVLCGVGQCVCYALTDLVIHNCMAAPSGYLPAAVMLLISLLSALALLLHLCGISTIFKRLCAQCALIALAVMIVEIGIFNGKSFCMDDWQLTYSAAEMKLDHPDQPVERQMDGLHITGNAKINLDGLPPNTRAIVVHAEQDEGLNNFRIQLSVKDGNFSKQYITVADKGANGTGYPCEFAFQPYEKLHSIQLQFLEVYNRTIRLSSVTAMNAIPFRFSLWRYFFLFGLCVLIAAIRLTGFAKVRYDHTNRSHRLAAAGMTVLCVSTMLFFHVPEQKFVEYPLTGNIEDYDPYTQTFDAFQKGQLWLDIEADPGLAELDNVYDNSLRAGSGITAEWDRAYYEGKYYSYFGIAPVLTFFYPVYWCTGSLPPMETVNEFFAVFAILFLCLAVQAAVRLFVPRTNLLLMLLLMPVMTCLCGAYYCFQYPDFYGAAVASALCFTFAGFWLGCNACLTDHKASRLAQFAACGLSAGLAVASRPSMAISLLVLAPVFLSILLDKQSPLRYRFQQAGAFLLPVIACAAGLMWYNQARFGSPLDFGAAYQLTVSDIHANQLRLSALPSAIYHYFLHMPCLRNVFPHFGMLGLGTANYQAYVYLDIIMGACFTPILLAGMLLLPASLRMSGRAVMVQKLRERGFLIGCFVMALCIAWADFCLAGVHLRYLFDLMPVLILGSICTILRTTMYRRKTQYGLMILCAVLSVVMVAGLMLSDKSQTTAMKYPHLFETLEDLVIFWQ